MSAKHTPGPWKLETESRSYRGSDLLITDAGGGYTIADCRDATMGVPREEEAEANAKLIAAAPALADALQDLMLDCGLEGDDASERFARANAALRLAGRL